jgi:hypothetical protein
MDCPGGGACGIRRRSVRDECLVATLAHGQVAMFGLIFVGLFHSIMFPTIFPLAIRGLLA